MEESTIRAPYRSDMRSAISFPLVMQPGQASDPERNRPLTLPAPIGSLFCQITIGARNYLPPAGRDPRSPNIDRQHKKFPLEEAEKRETFAHFNRSSTWKAVYNIAYEEQTKETSSYGRLI